MANAAPATVTVTSTTGPGQAVTAQRFTDVVDFEVDFNHNVIRVTRQGAGGTQVYDYSAMATLTWTISDGLTTIVVSS